MRTSALYLYLGLVAAFAGRPHGQVQAKSDKRFYDQSDSGRGLIPRSALDEANDHEASDDDSVPGPRGLKMGLIPESVLRPLVVEREHRRLELELLECRSRFVDALREAGPGAQRAASAAFQVGRDLLDEEREAALAAVLPTDAQLDSGDAELAVIQDSLAAGRRGPASDVLEARARRLVRLSSWPLDDAVLDAKRRFRRLGRSLWRAVDRIVDAEIRTALREELEGPGDPAAAGAAVNTLEEFRTCLRHRLLPWGAASSEQ